MISKLSKIILNALPIIVMIGLILFIQNDYILTLIYILVIGISFSIHKEKNDSLSFIFGFIVMIIAETFFVKTGVETFIRNSLFGLMPLWLPFLWAYSFVAIKRTLLILN